MVVVEIPNLKAFRLSGESEWTTIHDFVPKSNERIKLVGLIVAGPTATTVRVLSTTDGWATETINMEVFLPSAGTLLVETLPVICYPNLAEEVKNVLRVQYRQEAAGPITITLAWYLQTW